MNENHKLVFLNGKMHQISEPAGISYFAGNIIVAVTSKDKNSLLKEKALSVAEILEAMHEEGYHILTTEDILSFSAKYRIIHYNFFIALCRKVYEILRKKAPDITIKKYFDAIGKESIILSRYQIISLLGKKFFLLGEKTEETTLLQRVKSYVQGLMDLIKGDIIKNPRFLYKNLDFYNFTINCLKAVVHESKKDIENHQIGIEYVIIKDIKKFDYFNEFNIQHAKTILKWIPINYGCSNLSVVIFSIKNGNPFYTVKYFPEKFSLKKTVAFLGENIKSYDQMLLEQMQREIEINQKNEILEKYFHEVFFLQSQLNEFLCEVPENERAKRLHSIMQSILHDWDKHIKNIEYFGAKIEDGLKSINLFIPRIDNGGEGGVDEKLSDCIKMTNYITFEARNLNINIEAIRNYNNFANNYEKVNINKVIKTIFEVEKYKIRKYKNAFFLAPETENILIKANPYQLNNIISNLIDNAVKHGDINHPEFYINLHVSLPPLDKGEGEYLKILVENKGGISRQNYENLVNACKKGGKFTTSKKGEGQGLKNVIEVINNYNGKYVIPYNGEKFIFIVYLPL